MSQTPAPFTVATGFVFSHQDPSIQPEPHFSRQCDLLVYDPTVSRPLYAIDAFCVVVDLACKFVMEVKSALKKETLEQLTDVWLSVAGLRVPVFGFAYTSGTFENVLKLLSQAIVAAPESERRLTRLPECICVHKKNILAFRRRPSDNHMPAQYMGLNFGAVGVEAVGAATSRFLEIYDAALRGHEIAEMNRPCLFNEIPLPEEAKAWIDRSGKITFGNLPMRPPWRLGFSVMVALVIRFASFNGTP